MLRFFPFTLAALVLAACHAPDERTTRAAHAPLFDNGGFEDGGLSPAWVVNTYLNNTGLANPPWPPASIADLRLVDGGTLATRIVTNAVPESQPFAGMTAAPNIPRWPKLGNNSVVVNELGSGSNVNSLKQAYTTGPADVDPTDQKIHVRFLLAPALQAAGHTQEEQPYFFVILRNLTAPRAGTLFTSFNFSNSPGTPWRSQGTGANAVLYTDWTIFDIAPGNIALRPGDRVELEVIAARCQPSGHFGEVYVDGFGATFPGLSVFKTGPAQVNVDSDLTWNFTVRNNTSGQAPNVTVDETLPADTTFVSINAPGAACTTPPVGGTGTITCNYGWMNPGASATFQVTVRAYPPASSGTPTSATATTLSDTLQTWTVDQWVGWSLSILSGTGAGQERLVGSNTATQLTVANAWTVTPDATSRYALVNAPAVAGRATAGTVGSLTDSTRTWVTNEWSNFTLAIVAGQGVGQQRVINDNTATRLDVKSNWTTTPNATSVYAIKRAPRIINGNYGVQADTVTRVLGPRVETAITAGIPFTDLAITKSDGVAALAWGSPTRYTVRATNNGPLAVTGARVTDVFPAELAPGATWTCSGTGGGTCAASGTGNVNELVDLPVGASVTFLIDAVVVAGSGSGTLANIAAIAPPAGVTDNQPSNDADIDLDALGTLVTLTLQKDPAGAGQGTVTSSPSAINCGNACAGASVSFVSGTAVTLTAVARPGDTFVGWSGACSGSAITCDVTLNADTTVVARFKGRDVIGSAPGGNGTVTCAPSDVAQGGSSVCTITPASGFALASLTDNGVDVTSAVMSGTYTLSNVTVDHSVVAVFGPLPAVPTIQAPVAGSTTGDSTPTITGTTSPNVAVTVFIDGVSVCTTTSNGAGAFSCTPTMPLADGSRVVTATATNALGTAGPGSGVSFVVDTTAPATPTITSPANNTVIASTMPVLTGTAEPNSTVTVRVDGAVVGTATADASGNWTLTPTLTEGAHTIEVTSRDAAGNTSPPSMPVSLVVDLTAPAAPTVASPGSGAVTGPSPVFSGSAEPNSTVTVVVDGMVLGTTVTDAMGAWAFPAPAPLAAGAHTVSATARDAAGNTSAASTPHPFTTAAPPAAPVVSAPTAGSTTSDATPTFSGTAEPGSTVTVTVDGRVVCSAAVDLGGAWQCAPASPLADGPHVVTTTASNPAGDSPPSSPIVFSTDTRPPLTPAVVGPADGSRTSDTTPTVTGTGEPGAQIEVRIDGLVVGTTTVAPDGTFSFAVPGALALGSHTVSATSIDAAGNVSLGSNVNTFTVEPPGAPVVITPPDNSMTSDATPTLSGTAPPSSTVTVLVDGVAACVTTADLSGAFSCEPMSPLADGVHTVSAAVSSDRGASSSNTHTFTVDTTAPTAPVIASPAAGSTVADTTPQISGTAEPFAVVTVFIDGVAAGTTTADASGAWAFTPTMPLAIGAHTVNATATDRAGNTSLRNADVGFTVSSSTSPVTIVAPLDGTLTRDSRPAFSGSAPPSSMVEVLVDGVVVCTTTASANGAWTCSPGAALGEGAHVATARVVGSTTASSATTFTVDSIAPAAPVVRAPAEGGTAAASPELSGTAEPGARVTAFIDGQAVCTTLADPMGNWSCTPASALTSGSHTVSATATDPAGNVSAPSTVNNFTVDADAPAPPVLDAPAAGASLADATPEFSGSAEPGSDVTVFVDGVAICRARADANGRFSCSGTTPLAVGEHRVVARATDGAGNTSAPSVERNFFVTPDAPLITQPAEGSATGASALISGTGMPGSTVTVREGTAVLCEAVVGADGRWECTPTTPLTEGAHAVTATATAAGATGPASPPRNFTIDSRPPVVTVTGGPAPGGGRFEVSVDEPATLTCSLDGGPFVPCGPTVEFSDLAPGENTVEVRATDAAGNVSTTSTTFLVPSRATYSGGGCGCDASAVQGVLLLAALGLLGRRRRG